METPAPASITAPIVCRVTPWYYRRMAMMAGIMLVMGLFFLYDGQYGYHNANKIVDKMDWFEKVHLKSYDEAAAAGKIDQWIKESKAKGLPVGKDDEPPRWVAYAAENGWPEKPHRHTDDEITAQFWWGGATLLASLIVATLMLLNRNKVLKAEADHWITPEGLTIHFSQVFRVDKRKWDNKGLAYVWYRETAEAPEKKALIDDLKFDGAGKILARLLTHFKGELIEKIEDSPQTNLDDKTSGQ